MNIITEIIDKNRGNRPGTIITPTYITVHNTSNLDKGADANAHSRLVRNKGYNEIDGVKNWVSWHYTVDDNLIIQQLPINEMGYHAGRTANLKSIAIEICMHEGINQNKANENAAMLIAKLCDDLNIKISNIVTHNHWTKKNCPVLLLKNWDNFLLLIRENLKPKNLKRGRMKSSSTSDEVKLCWIQIPEVDTEK